MINYLIKSVHGNVITPEFHRIDPSKVLSGDCLEVFYETVSEIELYTNVTSLEWNRLVFYMQQLDAQIDDSIEIYYSVNN